uniref:DUF4781 domain-containing protein n=1 Tax=Plectus sambesii TaxID=2011161 RepID=A0A914XKA9_9BILA
MPLPPSSPKLDWSTDLCKEWQRFATAQQNMIYQNNRGVTWDEHKLEDRDTLITTILQAVFGPPSEELSSLSVRLTSCYNHEQRATAKKIVRKIEKISTSTKIKMQVVYLSAHFPSENGTANIPMFRVSCDKSCKYVDGNCRTYSDWQHVLNTNEISKSMYCYPENGQYGAEIPFDVNSLPKLRFGESPSCSIIATAMDGTQAMLSGADVVMTAASFVTRFKTVGYIAKIAPTIQKANNVVLYAALASTVLNTGGNMYDKYQHDQEYMDEVKLLCMAVLNPLGDYLSKRIVQGCLEEGKIDLGALQTVFLSVVAASRFLSASVTFTTTIYHMLYKKEKCTPSDYSRLALSIYMSYGTLTTPKTAKDIFSRIKEEYLMQQREQLQTLEEGISNENAKQYYKEHMKPQESSANEYIMNKQLIRVMECVDDVNGFFCEFAYTKTTFDVKDNILLVNGQLNDDGARLAEIGQRHEVQSDISDRLNANMEASRADGEYATVSKTEQLLQMAKDLDTDLKAEPDGAKKKIIEEKFLAYRASDTFFKDERLTFEAECHQMQRQLTAAYGQAYDTIKVGGKQLFASMSVTEYGRLAQVLDQTSKMESEQKVYNKNLIAAASALASHRECSSVRDYCCYMELINDSRKGSETAKEQFEKDMADPKSDAFVKFNEQLDKDLKQTEGLLKGVEHPWESLLTAMYHARKHRQQFPENAWPEGSYAENETNKANDMTTHYLLEK